MTYNCQHFISVLLSGVFVVFLSGCTTNSPYAQSSMQPAYLEDANDEALSKISKSIADHKDRNNVELGGIAKEKVRIIPVLPLPLSAHDTLSSQKPEIFKVFKTINGCIIVSEDNGAEISLQGINCKLDE